MASSEALADARGETAIIAPVAAAETVVSRHRSRLDESAGRGIPAHVTVLYPFVSPAELDDQVLAGVGAVASTLTTVEVTFRDVRWFDDRVAYLAPDPEQWFRDATSAMWDSFPQYPPYAGQFDDVVPHLTIGAHPDTSRLRAAAKDVSRLLPFTGRVDRLLLLKRSDAKSNWTTFAVYHLAP